MAGVDQILRAIVQQGADELRLVTDQPPLVFAHGSPRRFTMSSTPEPVLRQLLNPLLTLERMAELERMRQVTFEYRAEGVGVFQVALGRGAAGLEATFTTHGAPPPPPDPNATNARREAPRGGAEPVAPAPAPDALPVTMTARLLELVEQAVTLRASDIHLSEGEAPYLRVDGQLRRLDAATGVGNYLQVAPRVRAEVTGGHAIDLALELEDRQRLRVSIYTTQAGLAAAIRLLPRAAPALEALELPLSLGDLADVPHGLVLIAGATGSGKSTTMAALCRRALERRSVVLVTLEDPIEFALGASARSIVRQRQVRRDVPDFTTGLRDALRSDPDVIMVGELRDAETIRLALTAAETGHLVLASLHSGSAAGAVERVLDAYPAEQRAQVRSQLADALRAVVVQRLLPRARGSGRVPAIEVLRATHAIQNLVREGKTAQIAGVLQGGSRDGMLSLERCLADYVRGGVITAEHARAAANDLDSLAQYLGK